MVLRTGINNAYVKKLYQIIAIKKTKSFSHGLPSIKLFEGYPNNFTLLETHGFRFCLIAFTLFTMIATVAVFIAAPHVIVT